MSDLNLYFFIFFGVGSNIKCVAVPSAYTLCYLLPAAQGSVHSVDGILADVDKHRVHKHIHIQSSTLGVAGGCSLALKQTRNSILN